MSWISTSRCDSRPGGPEARRIFGGRGSECALGPGWSFDWAFCCDRFLTGAAQTMRSSMALNAICKPRNSTRPHDPENAGHLQKLRPIARGCMKKAP